MGLRRRSASTIPIGILSTLALLIVAFGMVLAPLSAPAGGTKFATVATMPSNEECDDQFKIVPEYFPGATVYWICENGRWHILDIDDGPNAQAIRRFDSSSPPYRSYVNSGVARGYTNGFGVASYSLRNPNNTPLVRDIGVRFLIKNRTTGGTCADTNWHGRRSSFYTWEIAKNLPGTCGGTAYYETAAAGRFWSISLNRWITNSWVQSGRIRLVNCCR
jgi:hypothetical protein